MQSITICNDQLSFDNETIKSRLLFDECDNLDVDISQKVLKVGIYESKNMKIVLNGLVHKLEIYKSHDITIYSPHIIPLFDIQNSSNIRIYHHHPTKFYLRNVMYIKYNDKQIPAGIWGEFYFDIT